jgi:hypothetical protein
MNQDHNNKLVGEKVNIVHHCSSRPNYIDRGIISNVLEGEVVHFAPLDGNEFGKSLCIVRNLVYQKTKYEDGLQITCLTLMMPL